MTYRDDADALRARVQVLEQSLEQERERHRLESERLLEGLRRRIRDLERSTRLTRATIEHLVYEGSNEHLALLRKERDAAIDEICRLNERIVLLEARK